MGDNANHQSLINRRSTRSHAGGFSLLEVLTALGILALVSSSVLLVINRCLDATADSALRMEAFLLARGNLEQILVSDSVEEMAEYGTSDEYPDISWQTVVEGFPDATTGQLWVRAVCSAEYMDSTGETQTVELVHWITELTDEQAGQLVQEEDLEQLEAEQLILTVEDAADYAGVDSETIEQWVENGLLTTADGSFIRYNLDLFMEGGGDPTEQEKAEQVESIQELAMKLRMEQEGDFGGPLGPGGEDSRQGRSDEQIGEMDAGELMNRLRER
jgi:prepilin-type N-terminal cleavage/methylation domain-containing protein